MRKGGMNRACIRVVMMSSGRCLCSVMKKATFASLGKNLECVVMKQTLPQNLNLDLCLGEECRALPLLPHCIVIMHIFMCLPKTRFMLWCCWQVNRSWSKVIHDSVTWNALEIVKINHKSYFNPKVVHPTVGWDWFDWAWVLVTMH